MKPHWDRALALALAMLLAGCFQQAGEAFQPANSTIEPLPLDVTNTPEENAGATPVEGMATTILATSTLPITVISPPTRGPASATPQQPPTLQTNVEVTATEETPAFITPAGPPLPVPSNSPAPTIQGSSLTSGSATPSGLITPTALSNDDAGGCTYTVQPGDNLFRISVNHNTTVEDMRAVNPELVGEAPILQPGQVLQIPGCGAETTTTTTTDLEPTPGAEPNQTTPTGGTTYTVQSGDTLFRIAQRFGVTVAAIVEANNLANPDSLSIGQQLIIPPAS
jgi:LysM repeat protein